jgi:hypothetical protein
MGTARWTLLVGLVGLVAAAACTGDGDGDGGGGEPDVSDDARTESSAPGNAAPDDVPDADLQEFCEAYDVFVEANRSDLAVDELRAVVELAPPGTEAHFEVLLPMWELMAGMDPDSDATGSLDYMSLVVELREPGPRAAEARLQRILVEDCGREPAIVIG